MSAPQSELHQTSTCSSPFTLSLHNNTNTSRSSTPSHLFLKKTLFDVSQSGQKISESLSLLSADENQANNLNYTAQSHLFESFSNSKALNTSSGWKVMGSNSSENAEESRDSQPISSCSHNNNNNNAVTATNTNNLPVKALSSEDTMEALRDPKINHSGFIIDYDDSFSAPVSVSAEDASMLISEREIVLDIIDLTEYEEEHLAGPIVTNSKGLVLPEESEAMITDEELRREEGSDEVNEEEQLRLQLEKEERESQELIWELMRQEQMDLYQMQVQFMQSTANMEGLSEEDMRAIQETMTENNHLLGNIQTYSTTHQEEGEDNEEEEEGEGEGEEEEGEAEEEEEEEEWDYERLLALGQALGDVKTERWRAKSKQVIESLPVMTYQTILQTLSTNNVTTNNKHTKNADVIDITDEAEQYHPLTKKLKTNNSCSPSSPVECVPHHHSHTPKTHHTGAITATFFQDYRCVVCMEDFEAAEECRVLPCTHYFHSHCTAGWLSDHNSCPTCKKKVIASPEK